MINSDFKFGTSCSNVAYTCETTQTTTKCVNITAVDSTKYTCSIASNVIIFDLTTDIIAG